ncbi:Ribonuclease P protein component [bioreactor metagenome]|uniref:Ribonuclease P protein component n=1 Tax=bioreactor metagenome TaxID=1076179 RepID=A0A645CXI7_9ZZZZ|nr:ribonuclease P protein component [Oscillospiraceae bacterium]
MKLYTIKENRLFGRAYAKGKSSPQKHIAVYMLPSKPKFKTKYGITVNKKLAGSVGRNRGKRLIREAYRALYPEIESTGKYYILIFVARTRLFNKNVKTGNVLSDMRTALRELGILPAEKI